MKVRFFIFSAMLVHFSVLSIAQKEEALTNKTVVDLYNAGISKETIITKIESSATRFDVSVNGMIALKKQRLPDEIINAMVKKSNAAGSSIPQGTADTATKNPPGIYYCKGQPCKFTELEASVYSQAKTGSGIMTVITYGAAKTKMKATLGTPNANLQIEEKKPSFYFYFDKSTSKNFGNNGAQTFWFASATSPNEFLIVKFTTTKKNREVVTGSWSTYAGMSSGIDDHNKVAFKYEKVSPGIYKVYTEQPLETGEYCFMYAGGTTTVYGGTPLQKVYDFGIK